MKTELKAKLLQHLLNKKANGGFTLIELLVVIIIIGILAAIALPSFLNQANRARQSEAVTYIGSINRAQQAYRLENAAFTSSIPNLGLGITPDTKFYTYAVSSADSTLAIQQATMKDTVLLGYAGVTYTLKDSGGNATTTAVLCKGDPGVVPSPTVNTPNTATAAVQSCNQ